MAEPKPSPVQLADVINYQPETYLTDDEIALLRDTFRNSPRLVKAIRKVLLPTVEDADLPIEEFGKDSFSMGYNFSQIPEEHIKALVLARQDAMKFVMGGIIMLKQIASLNEPTRQQLKEMRRKNSTQ